MFRYISALATAAVLATTAQASTTITFTEAGLPSLTPVTDQFQSLGIVAENFLLYEDGRDTFDNIGITPTAELALVRFTSPASNISIDYVQLSNTLTNIFLLDSSDSVLASFDFESGSADVNLSFLLGGSNVRSLQFVGVSGRFGLSTLRFDTGSTGAVPEPASWAMLIAGFGLVGAAMRRRLAATA